MHPLSQRHASDILAIQSALRDWSQFNMSALAWSANPASNKSPDMQLAEELKNFVYDPLGFVLFAYPWGKKGTSLEKHDGPDNWQREFLRQLGEHVRKNDFDGFTPVMPVRMSRSSGHGIGKSTLVAWIADWIRSTRPMSKGTVTANTFTQLKTKTWAAIQTWCRLSITKHWFKVTNESFYHLQYPEAWRCDAQSCKEENSEAFAGQHAADSTSYYIFDEASAIPDAIFTVAEGGLTDGEPMVFMFGNSTRNSGKFHRVNFGAERERWDHGHIDSRTAKMSNKALIAEWEEDYGTDSDFFRVRVLGLPPRAGDSQFIDMERILKAQKREVRIADNEPLVAGVDLAWGGEDKNVIRFRRGNEARNDGKHLPKPVKIPGELTRDPAVLTVRLADILSMEHDCDGKKLKIQQMFIDSAGIAGPVGANLRALGHKNVMDVNFGADSPDPRFTVYFRDYMWGKMKQFLLTGAIDKDPQLETDCTGPGFKMNAQQQVKLEPKEQMKKRGVASPDDADALALTFAYAVAPPKPAKKPAPGSRQTTVTAWS